MGADPENCSSTGFSGSWPQNFKGTINSIGYLSVCSSTNSFITSKAGLPLTVTDPRMMSNLLVAEL